MAHVQLEMVLLVAVSSTSTFSLGARSFGFVGPSSL